MECDPLWSLSDLATIVAKIIESMRLIPKTTIKMKPFEAHFGRSPNTELFNIVTRAKTCHTKKNKYTSDQATLRHQALTRQINVRLGQRLRTRAQHRVQSAVGAYPKSNDGFR